MRGSEVQARSEGGFEGVGGTPHFRFMVYIREVPMREACPQIPLERCASHTIYNKDSVTFLTGWLRA